MDAVQKTNRPRDSLTRPAFFLAEGGGSSSREPLLALSGRLPSFLEHFPVIALLVQDPADANTEPRDPVEDRVLAHGEALEAADVHVRDIGSAQGEDAQRFAAFTFHQAAATTTWASAWRGR